jgi:hypothetical protein
MNVDKYALNKVTLRFRDSATESSYKDYIVQRTLLFCRIAWGLVIFLGGVFSLLDRPAFGENSTIVLLLRLILLTVAAIVLTATFFVRFRQLLDLSSGLFILSVGLFCIYQIAISDPAQFTPYFTGLFLAFTGIFSTAGLGFRYSFIALLLNLIVFEIVLGLLVPVSLNLFVVYNFFLLAMILIFIFIGYLVERISRDNFIVSARLSDSLSQVRTLGGLLPICARCKKIRDDKGYWKQLELYLRDHTDAQLSHGICPECASELYPDIDLGIKDQQ